MIGEHLSSMDANRDLCAFIRNAIKVENISRTQVGHIPKQFAAKLAPLMDRGEVTVEGVMLEGNCVYPTQVMSFIILTDSMLFDSDWLPVSACHVRDIQVGYS